MVWQATVFLGFVVVFPIAVAAVLGRKQKRDTPPDVPGEK
jgi:hypothetical protein